MRDEPHKQPCPPSPPAMAVVRLSPLRATLELTVILLEGLAVLLIFLFGRPFRRGFFCDDESIRHPVKADTVPSLALALVALGLPLIVRCDGPSCQRTLPAIGTSPHRRCPRSSWSPWTASCASWQCQRCPSCETKPRRRHPVFPHLTCRDGPSCLPAITTSPHRRCPRSSRSPRSASSASWPYNSCLSCAAKPRTRHSVFYHLTVRRYNKLE